MPTKHCYVKLQWGRTFSSAEVIGLSGSLQSGVELQWGRTFSSAEVLRFRLQADADVAASMGPHFFKCGSCDARRVALCTYLRFNGAALFQVRK